MDIKHWRHSMNNFLPTTALYNALLPRVKRLSNSVFLNEIFNMSVFFAKIINSQDIPKEK